MKGLNAVSGKEGALFEYLAFVAGVFWGPDSDTCARWKEGTPFPWAGALSPLLDERFRRGVRGMVSHVERYGAADLLHDDLETEYVRLFVNAREGIAAPLNQSCYEGENAPVMGAAAAAMKKRLTAAGLSVDGAVGDPPDHVSIQLEYLYFLVNLAVDGDTAALSESAAFAGNIMSPWISDFCLKLRSAAGPGFYSAAAATLLPVLEFISGFAAFPEK